MLKDNSGSRKRNPSRRAPTAGISVTWKTYDDLDRLATEHNLSLAKTVVALIDHYNAAEARKKDPHKL